MSWRGRKLSDWHANYGVNPSKQMLIYRNGAPSKISLAPIFSGRERRSVVDSAMDVLRDWRLSPFENEGTVRAGVRAALCLKGHGWHRADYEASLVVEAGLNRMGAQRPSWEQGQREYTVPAENCAWCGGLRDEAMKGRFCGIDCSSAFITDRRCHEVRRDTAIYQSAMRVLRRDKKDRRNCLHCGRAFMHDGDRDPRKFCSQSCYGSYQKSDASATYDCTCKFCERAFRGKHADKMYCSNACQIAESRLRTGRNLPKTLSPSIFDYVITRPVNEHLRSQLTPLHLDWILMEAGLRITGQRMAA